MTIAELGGKSLYAKPLFFFIHLFIYSFAAFLQLFVPLFSLLLVRYEGPRKMRVVLGNVHGNNADVETESSLLHRMLRGTLDSLEEPCLVNRNPRWNAKVNKEMATLNSVSCFAFRAQIVWVGINHDKERH